MDFDTEVRLCELEKQLKEQQRLMILVLKSLDLAGPDEQK